MKNREDIRELEWVVEREIGPLSAAMPMMPWTRGGDDDRLFRGALVISVLFSLSLSLLATRIVLPVPEQRAREVVAISERLVHLLEKKVEPPPVVPPAPKPRVEPVPEPVVARKPPPVPEPVIAKVPPPPPAPVPLARPKPAPPAAKPIVKIDAVKPPPTPQEFAPTRAERNPVPTVARRGAPPMPSVAPLAAAPVGPTSDAPRVANSRPSLVSRPARPDLQPALLAGPAAPAPPGSASTRGSRDLPDARPRSSSAVPRPDLTAPTAVPGIAESAAPRAARIGAAAPTHAQTARPDVQVAALAAPARGASASAAGSASGSAVPVARGARSAPSSQERSAAPDQALAGVPLGSLAACVSEREEDVLKQRVVAAARTQEKCVSAAGTYRFVETKNLNSFLMWVQPAKGRAQGDRCNELRLAIECLQPRRSR